MCPDFTDTHLQQLMKKSQPMVVQSLLQLLFMMGHSICRLKKLKYLESGYIEGYFHSYALKQAEAKTEVDGPLVQSRSL